MKITTKELIVSTLFVALITIGTFIRIPIGNDYLTLQFLFTLLAGLVLGANLGGTAVLVYVFLGLAGVPVFASGGGFGYILQPTFGYLIGFIIQAWFCGKFSRKLSNISCKSLVAVNFGGLLIVYTIGISWFYIFSNYVVNAPISVWATLFYCVILQILPDFALCVGAATLGYTCYRRGLWLS